MSSHTQTRTTTSARGRLATDPAYQAFMLLRTVFTVAPVLFGLDKFFNDSSTGRSTWRRGSTGSCRGRPSRRCTPLALSRSSPAFW